MIGRLQGKLIQKKPPQILVDVAGVGYELDVTMNTLYQCPEEGQAITLHTHLVVREDLHCLYGFASLDERDLFRILIKVNGVGPKLALTILSSMTVTAFVQCVQQQAVSALVKVPGIGKKTAERLLIEMRDRLNDWQGGGRAVRLPATSDELLGCDAHSAVSDAISALVALGYKPQQANQAVAKLPADNQSSETLIRQALQQLAS